MLPHMHTSFQLHTYTWTHINVQVHIFILAHALIHTHMYICIQLCTYVRKHSRKVVYMMSISVTCSILSSFPFVRLHLAVGVYRYLLNRTWGVSSNRKQMMNTPVLTEAFTQLIEASSLTIKRAMLEALKVSISEDKSLEALEIKLATPTSENISDFVVVEQDFRKDDTFIQSLRDEVSPLGLLTSHGYTVKPSGSHLLWTRIPMVPLDMKLIIS